MCSRSAHQQLFYAQAWKLVEAGIVGEPEHEAPQKEPYSGPDKARRYEEAKEERRRRREQRLKA